MNDPIFPADVMPPRDPYAETIAQLQSFCRGEMSAVEAYATALAANTDDKLRDVLRSCLLSHQERVLALEAQIRLLGGDAPKSAGAWGALATVMEQIASALGAAPALYVLEQGEEHGLRDYRRDIERLDPTTRAFVVERILRSQLETRKAIDELRRRLN